MGKSCVIRKRDEQVGSRLSVMTVNTALRDYLLSRRTVTAPFLAEPGPSPEQLAEMLEIACRVPDHGKLAPWRFVVFEGDARQAVGDRLHAIAKAKCPSEPTSSLNLSVSSSCPRRSPSVSFRPLRHTSKSRIRTVAGRRKCRVQPLSCRQCAWFRRPLGHPLVRL